LVTLDPDLKEQLFLAEEPRLSPLLEEAFVKGLKPLSYVQFTDGHHSRIEAHAERQAVARLLTLDIIYCDEAIVVVNKPVALHAIPGKGSHKQDSVTSRLKAIFTPNLANPAVHRLDYDTSGLMVLALTKESQSALAVQFAKRTVYKKYVALVEGEVGEEQGEITLAFRYDSGHKPRQKYDPVLGKWGETKWHRLALETYQGRRVSRLELIPLTGRTHQLRLHTSHPKGLGAPIVGDTLYGTAQKAERLMLHACTLAFRHPLTDELIEFYEIPPF